MATSFPVPILSDQTQYSLVVPAMPEASPATLILLNRRFFHGIPITRRLVFAGELPPFVGSALDVWYEADRLRASGIPFCIEPSYPFDFDTPASAFGPPNGPISYPVDDA